MNWTDDQMGRYTDVWMDQWVGAWMKVVGDLASIRDSNLLNSPCPLRDGVLLHSLDLGWPDERASHGDCSKHVSRDLESAGY